jgi:hypothetical protein
MLLKSGLVMGGSLENVIVLDKERVMNPDGLRFPDEFCRHKVLDLIGDISLFGHPIIGHVVADRAGHAMHAQLVSRLLRQKECWTLTTTEPARSTTSLSTTAGNPGRSRHFLILAPPRGHHARGRDQFVHARFSRDKRSPILPAPSEFSGMFTILLSFLLNTEAARRMTFRVCGV